ncbi:hypothetical protein [Polymorphobacter fuscus]|uniref:DUF4403 family protein n=1 Tax=Sandarakinorhabdus fusca TaxID=1439888 RepID=A0A7C9KWL6_9SPHN|nr:hypothetical protein [Polymorphobacter fuscus]KAB7647804.1 hypothetical protein F9290_07505 [Polymorphobacter fuscus]MQT17105.1 hypothetical protein [Polymorphobacter fuscus]NJC08903.1 hypothetical protein [Polymorphobacter fuscus]
MRALPLFLLLAAAPAGAETPAAADQRAQLARATTRLNAAAAAVAGQPFATSRRIHVDLDQRVFGTWLAAVAPNGLRASATGTAVDGALVTRQRPLLGPFTATIAPASATRLDVVLANPRINAARDRLTVTGALSGDARAQVRVAGVGIDQTVACRTQPPVRENGIATFDLGAGSGSRYPFTLRLTTPDNLLASLDCDIAELRQIENVLPINSIAGELAGGTIDIGLSPSVRLPTPGAGRPMMVVLDPRRPTLRITPRGLAYSAD